MKGMNMQDNSFNPIWEEIHSKVEWGKYPSESVIRFVARNYYRLERKNVKILDFGCGGGSHTWYLSREGFDTYAFDGSESAIEKLKIRLENENLSADLRVRDGANLDYPDEFFDAVIDSVCIYANKLNHIKLMYNSCFNMLKKGGKLFTSVFGTATSGYGTGDEIEEKTYENVKEGPLVDRGTVHFFDETDMTAILGEIGFLDIVVEPMTYFDRGVKIEILNVHAVK